MTWQLWIGDENQTEWSMGRGFVRPDSDGSRDRRKAEWGAWKDVLIWLLSCDLRLSKVKMLSYKAETRCLQEERARTGALTRRGGGGEEGGEDALWADSGLCLIFFYKGASYLNSPPMDAVRTNQNR